jgi:glycosyltransferase involved in cell wall biosynthesis
MQSPLRRWAWPITKSLLALAIIIAVAWQFWRDLHHESLQSFTIRWEWVVLSGLLYFVGLGFACCYWYRLLVIFGERPLFLTALRAYYISQLGKYLPGKAWALLMRGTLIQGPAVKLSVALITTFYEVLTTMTSGALLAALLFSFQQPRWLGGTWNAALAGLVLAVVCGAPLWPGIFNRTVKLLKGRFQHVEGFKLPGVGIGTLIEGLVITSGVWVCFGLSLWAMIQGLLSQAEPLTVDAWVRHTAIIGLACGDCRPRRRGRSRMGAGQLAGAGADGRRSACSWAADGYDRVAAPRGVDSGRSGDGGVGLGIAKTGEGRGVISLIIPVLDEQDSLATLVGEIDEMARRASLAIEVIFVDDGSRDGSWRAIAGLAGKYPWVHGIRFRRNFGKAAALSAGFRAARGDVIFTLDADLQDDPAEIPRLFARLADRNDVVSGWKRIRRDPWHKVLPSRLFNLMVSWLTGVKLHDHNCGIKCYRAQVLREVRLYGELHRFIPVLAAARGFRVDEMEINHRPRRYGRSKYGVRRFLKGFLDLLTVKFLTGFGQRPQHILGTIGIIFFALGGLGMLYLAVTWVVRLFDQTIFTEPLHDRPLLLYSVAALLLGAQVMAIGFLAELITAYQSRDEDCYSIADQTGNSSTPTKHERR